jgi:phenylalanyl-tRNA synthetase beta chain
MKAPLSWLQQYVDITLPLDELAHRLTMGGTEVESVTRVGADWEKIVTARIVAIDRHPNADNLLVTRLEAGTHGTATVVTGATNLAVGNRVPWIQPGGRLGGGRVIEVSELRGLRSEGMLCSGDELGISPDRSGIYVLEPDIELGRLLRDLYSDTVIDVYITPNRVDCMSIYGVAREIHALTGAPLRRIQVALPTGDERVDRHLAVRIDAPDLCRRFTGAYIGGVEVRPSPGWLQRRLALAGVRPISNLVDATNYVMLELGQPQHAFDADQLGRQIVVRRSRAGEQIETLDGTMRELDGEMLVIADAEKAVAVAGVMGGGPTEVTNATRNLILESANFLPTSIRKTSSALKLGSEASRRFERGLHPELAMIAAQHAVKLIVEIAGGRSAAGIVDVYPTRLPARVIDVSERDISAFLGQAYSRDQVAGILRSLDFEVVERDERLSVTVPIHRLDVEGRPDIAEEVARITGYDAIPDTLPTGAPPEPRVDPWRLAAERTRDVLAACGLSEVMTYSLVGPGANARVFGEGSPDGVTVANAISADQCVLRTSLLPSVLEALRSNLRHRDAVAIFEAARVYPPPFDPLPNERLLVSIAVTGPALPTAWNQPAREVDFYDLKGAVDTLLAAFGLVGTYESASTNGYHPGQCARLVVDGVGVGQLGRLHPTAAERCDLGERNVFVAELELDTIATHAHGQGQIHALPRFPAVARDLALVVDGGVGHDALAAELRVAGGDLLADLTLFDVYRGAPLPDGKVSLAFALEFRALDRTLTDDEVDERVAAMTAAVHARFGAVVRGG